MPATMPTDPIGTFAPGLFDGRTALVTGGGRGIGRATALGFARLGADVVIAARNPDTLAQTHADIEAMGRRCISVQTDIRDIPSVENLVATAWGEFGDIHFLINNAGGQFPASPSKISDRGWRAVIDLNLNGTWNVCSRAVPRMIETGYGSIVNMVHVQSFDRGAPIFAHSGAARAGVVNLTRTIALYLADHDINVNAIAPGAIDTEGFREEEIAKMDPDTAATIRRVLNDTPMLRLASADEVAAQMIFLCTPAGRFITGQALVSDGGMVLGNWTNSIQPAMPW
jgi:NAD(P)-dependent dehydrogenase (short-subunit alcohol dehydrogenase family)